MLYRIEFRLDHAPDPIEFDADFSQKPAEADVLCQVIGKLKPHEPAPHADTPSLRDKLMADNGVVSVSLFDEKGAALLTF
ncbi:hypothetical protein [Undibacterium sp.]|uniref:hypothetical protein n=1 Tax=Undibacterium sp. TaxID=1914977 RepID=UPI00374CFBED